MGSRADDTGSPHHQPSKESRSLDAAKKWLGVGAAALSVVSAVYGTLQYHAEKNARAERSTELLATSQIQQKARDYPAAWSSLKDAVAEIDKEGVLVRALGGLSAEQTRVHIAQEDLAMQWVRDGGSRAERGHLAEISDAVLPVLSSGASHAQEVRKADLLAHIGWAYWLKALDGAEGVKELQFYKEAIALDPRNPYANTFWAMPVIDQNNAKEAGVAQAKKLYDAALASSRATGELRQWIRTREFASVRTYTSYKTAMPFFWQVVGEMQKAGEPIDERWLSEVQDQYLANEISMTSFTDHLNAALTYLPLPVHIDLLQQLLKTQEDKERQGELQIVLALALEKAGKPQEALSWLRTARGGAAVSGLGGDFLRKQLDAAIQQLDPASAPAAAAAAPAAKPTPVSKHR